MILSELASAIVFAIGIASTAPGAELAIAALGTCAAARFHRPRAPLPNLAEAGGLARANSALAMARTVGAILGSLLSGYLLSADGPAVVFAFNAVSFVVSAAVISQIVAPL